MTRAERAAERAQRLKADLAAATRQLAQLEAQQRTTDRAKRAKRHQRIGRMADDAGLFVWQDATLAGLFQVLAQLQDTPDPVKVLDGLLAEATVPG